MDQPLLPRRDMAGVIRALRESVGISGEQLAVELDVSATWLALAESGMVAWPDGLYAVAFGMLDPQRPRRAAR